MKLIQRIPLHNNPRLSASTTSLFERFIVEEGSQHLLPREYVRRLMDQAREMTDKTRDPLSHSVLRYERPFDPVSEEDWDALQ